jgi:NAD(P)-dependent dehydrogenase (short-subunit alcohol dehydrogenase family)
MAGRLATKRACIVGGTSGLGLAAARRFLEEGAHTAIFGRDADKGAAAQAALASVGPVGFFQADAGDEAQISTAWKLAVDWLGGCDVPYHVAGISGRRFGDGPLHECTLEGWQTTIQANLTSVFLSNQLAVTHFLRLGQPGVILNMASVLGQSPAPQFFGTYAYTATKGGIVSMSRLAAARYAADRIRVNVLAPGLIDTPMAQRACHDPTILTYLAKKQPLSGGPGLPEQCADAAVFLCSSEADFVTGVVLPVDGGWSVSEGQLPG